MCPFDAAPCVSDVPVRADTDRSQFAAWLAQRANASVGARISPHACALARFYGCAMEKWIGRANWHYDFIERFDAWPRRPTGFDALTILNSIP